MKKGYLASAVVLTLAVVVFSAYVVSNENGGATLEGRWVLDLEQAPLNMVGVFDNVELMEDGIGIFNRKGNGWGGKFTWKEKNGRLYFFTGSIAIDDNAAVWDYKISDSTLTITIGDGRIATYTKQR